MPRFVLLHHETPPGYPRGTHYDLMLEQDEALRTWAMAEPPRPGVMLAAEQLADHRLAYLTYEGPVSGERGSVARWDQGEFTPLVATDDRWEVAIRGEKLVGTLHLERRAADTSQWGLRFVPLAD